MDKKTTVNNWMFAFTRNSNKAVADATKTFVGFSEKMAKFLHRYDREFAFRKAIEASL